MSSRRSRSSSRHRTPAEWQTILQQFATSGLSGPQFCKAQRIPYPTFHQWRQRLGATAKPSPVSTSITKPPTPFVELRQPDVHDAPQWHITLKLGNGVELCLSQM